jgi:hypothetical protein
MRFLYICLTLGLSGAALRRRWQMRVPWEGQPIGNLVLILAVGSLALLLADFLLNTRPVPGEEHTGWLEWGMRLLGIAAGGAALYYAYHP